jgi:hypothetical protein
MMITSSLSSSSSKHYEGVWKEVYIDRGMEERKRVKGGEFIEKRQVIRFGSICV